MYLAGVDTVDTFENVVEVVPVCIPQCQQMLRNGVHFKIVQ